MPAFPAAVGQLERTEEVRLSGYSCAFASVVGGTCFLGSATVLFLGLVENLGFAPESPGAGHASNRLKFLEGGRDILANGTHGLDEAEKSFLGEDFKKK